MEQNNNDTERQPRTAVLPPKNRKRKTGLWIFLGILLAMALFLLLTATNRGAVAGNMRGKPYVAVMYVEGQIGLSNYDSLGRPYGYQHYWTLDQLDQLTRDSDNKGLLLYVDSPGGSVYRSDELYLQLMEYKEITGRPIYVYMAEYATSGAYYISMAADQIFANRNTLTGSIGVTMGTMFDVSQLLEHYGIKTTTVDSGDNKNAGNPWEPLTDQQREILQSLVDEAYEQFVGVIAQGRNLPIDKIKETADGRLFTASQARELGYLDEIGSLEDAITHMQRTYKLWNCSFYNVSYDYGDGRLSLLDLVRGFLGMENGLSDGIQANADTSGSNIDSALNYICTLFQ